MALIGLVNEILKALDEGKIVLGMFLDLSEALATVDHSILLDKIIKYGIRGSTIEVDEKLCIFNGRCSSNETYLVVFHKVEYKVLCYCQIHVCITTTLYTFFCR